MKSKYIVFPKHPESHHSDVELLWYFLYLELPRFFFNFVINRVRPIYLDHGDVLYTLYGSRPLSDPDLDQPAGGSL